MTLGSIKSLEFLKPLRAKQETLIDFNFQNVMSDDLKQPFLPTKMKEPSPQVKEIFMPIIRFLNNTVVHAIYGTQILRLTPLNPRRFEILCSQVVYKVLILSSVTSLELRPPI